MTEPITTEDVSNQLAKAIKLLLDWITQEFRTTPTVPERSKATLEANLPTGRLLKANEIAKILQISRSTAYQMMLRNDIPTVHIGKAVRVRQEDLDNFIHQA